MSGEQSPVPGPGGVGNSPVPPPAVPSRPMPVPPPSPPQPILEPAVYLPPAVDEAERYRITNFVEEYGASPAKPLENRPAVANPTLGVVALLLSVAGFVLAGIALLTNQSTVFEIVDQLPPGMIWSDATLYAMAQISLAAPGGAFVAFVLAPIIGGLGVVVGIIAAATGLGRRFGIWAILIPLLQPLLLLLIVVTHRRLGL